MSDLLILAALTAVAALCVVFVTTTPPGALVRTGHHTEKWLDARDVPEVARHAALPAPAPAVEEPVTSPWAPPTALATIPDALNTVRTA